MEKMEPGSDNEPDLSARTSVANRSLKDKSKVRGNLSIDTISVKVRWER